MKSVTLISWTPRTVPNAAGESTLDILQPVIFDALRPFPEASEAMRLALREAEGK